MAGLSNNEQNTISIEQFMDCIQYKITGGYDYLWKCFGEDCYCIESEDTKHDQYSTSMVFSRVTHTVFAMEVWDYGRKIVYEWINPEYKQAYKRECREKDVYFKKEDGEDKKVYVELATDIISKTKSIVSGESYDDRVVVPLVLPDDELFRLMIYAHERDITLNQSVEEILRIYIDSHPSLHPDK